MRAATTSPLGTAIVQAAYVILALVISIAIAGAGLNSYAGDALAAPPQCSEDDIGEVVDSLASRLAAARADSSGDVAQKLKKLAAKEGLQGEDAEAAAIALVEDSTSRALDEKAASLLVKVNRLSEPNAKGGADACERLSELKATVDEIVSITASKSKHLSDRLDVALMLDNAPLPEGGKSKAAADTPKSEAKPAEAPKLKTLPDDMPRKHAEKDASKKAAAERPLPWETETRAQAPEPNPEFEMQPDPQIMAALPPVVSTAAETEFSESEIMDAGSGLFGNISSGLASVVQYAFNSYGRPNGYILGTEGGGAFIAGLRYGKGDYVTKFGGASKIYWQGPSIGYDFGADGARVMVLVYNLQNFEDIYGRFGGVDGSAYVVGGAGITFLRRGNVVLAPIRTGIGLRLGANVGYLKFTQSRSFNPF